MISLSKYHVSKVHGFCPFYEPYRYLRSLSPHISLLKKLPDCSLNEILSLPKFTEISGLNNQELELAFFVHSMLNSLYYWNSEVPNTVIPENLSEPTIKLSKILQRPPILGCVSTGYHNWKYINPIKKFHPDNIECIFSFSNTRDESHFYHCANYIEVLGAPAIFSLYKLHLTYDSSPIEKNLLLSTHKSIQQMRTGLDFLSAAVDPYTFYHGFRKKLKSFEKGVVFQGQNIEYKFLKGASAVQSPLLKFMDAVLGIEHNSNFLDSSEEYMKKEHREFLKVIRKKEKTNIKEYIVKNKLKDEWNSVIAEICAFRRDHVDIAYKFIAVPSMNKDNTGTGGSKIKEFLDELINNTQKQMI